MKLLPSFRALVVGAFCVPLAAAANVVPDPSFEARNWNLQDNTMSFVTSPTRTGSRSLKVVNKGQGNHNATSRDAPVAPGQEYTFSAFVRGENVTPADLGDAGQAPLAIVRFKNGARTLLKSGGKTMEGYRWAQVKTSRNPGGGTYGFQDKNMQMNMQVPKGAAFADFSVRTWWASGKGTKSGTTWWDDVSFKLRTFPKRGVQLATLQAENANTKSGGSVAQQHFDASGNGYVDVTGSNATGTLPWTNVPGGSGARSISVR
jgi:hypothetical protein